MERIERVVVDRKNRDVAEFIVERESPPFTDVTFNMSPSKVRWRRSALGKELYCLYNASSFLTWRYGRCFDTLLTISFSAMGFQDDLKAAALMAPFNKEMKRWLAVDQGQPRVRHRGRLRDAIGAPHLYIYTIEHGRDHGLHVHQLCIVPTKQEDAFRDHARRWWARAAGLTPACLPNEAIDLQHRPTKRPEAAYEQHNYWFRYIIKFVDKGTYVLGNDQRHHSVDEVLKPIPRDWQTQDVFTPQLHGICRDLDVGNQMKAGFISKLRTGEFEQIYSGWELSAYNMRQTLATLVI